MSLPRAGMVRFLKRAGLGTILGDFVSSLPEEGSLLDSVKREQGPISLTLYM